MVALPACMYVHHMHLVYGEAGVGHKCPETGVTASFVLTWGC